MQKHTSVQKYHTYKTVLWWIIGGSIVLHIALWVLLPGAAGPNWSLPPALALPGLLGTFILAIGSGFGLAFVNRWLWIAMGEAVGLTPAENGLPRSSLSHPDHSTISRPILTGTVRGRTVRARTFTVKSDGGDPDDSSSTTHMLVEADLEAPVEEGAVVTRGDADLSFSIPSTNSGDEPTMPSMSESFGDLTVVQEGAFYAQTNAESLLRTVLSGRTRNDLDAVASFAALQVGNAKAIYEAMYSSALSMAREAMPEIGGFSLESVLPSAADLADGLVYSDAQTVTFKLEDVPNDPDELDRQVTAAVAVADAFERARADADAS